jgi:hypothetical protein
MEFKRRKLQLIFEGKEYEMAFPTAMQSAELGELLQDNKTNLSYKVSKIQEMLTQLGLDNDVTAFLEMDQLMTIVEKFAEKKS